MKPFNLCAAIAGAKLQTRDGREVTEFYYCKTCCEKEMWPIVAVIGGTVFYFKKDGRYLDNDATTNNNDLFMVSEQKEIWINVWRQNKWLINHSSISHPSKEAALKARMEGLNYLGDPVKIWEEEV